MKKTFLLGVLLIFLTVGFSNAATLRVGGILKNEHGAGIDGVEVEILYNHKIIAKSETTDEGTYFIETKIKNSINPRDVYIRFDKTTYKTIEKPIENILHSKLPDGSDIYISSVNETLHRAITPAFWIALGVLVLTFALISFEVLHRTVAALFGASVLLFVSYTLGTFNESYFVLSFEEAVKGIDFNVILLLMSMMIIVGVMKKTGIFQWLAYKSYALSKGNVFKLSIILMFVTAVVSAFLDNVTTMLLIAPVSIEIALMLNINPLSLLIPEVIASNMGGTATLIGDPPNIMIGSYAHLTFNQFLINLADVITIILIVNVFVMKFFFGKEYKKGRIENVDELLQKLKEEYKITDKKLLNYCLFILGFVIVLFVTHGFLHMEPSIAAMIGASLILLFSGVDITEMMEHEVEWTTLVFFMMLFVIVEASVQTGVIMMVANWVKDLAGNSLALAIILIIWVSAIASAIVDNIPFTATMLPVVAYLTRTIPDAGNTLWWALALGACLGGNGTLIGASANVVTAGISERTGYPITFKEFLKVGVPATAISVAIGMVWLLLGG
ncbi:SLC13 family permease [Hippea maritima]|uniref:Citrate transporter n=1 Tax=Hippea maritima (strain ATCC 700847 / DSM 10411 / MH2) TaxID=760142 RepID=F2LW33_HIPMA|nr:ArsB/NhaD family transporter [Hippea maritima]AEA33967.1 Citrate transporter [Hippea maritima DSM 10411]